MNLEAPWDSLVKDTSWDMNRCPLGDLDGGCLSGKIHAGREGLEGPRSAQIDLS